MDPHETTHDTPKEGSSAEKNAPNTTDSRPDPTHYIAPDEQHASDSSSDHATPQRKEPTLVTDALPNVFGAPQQKGPGGNSAQSAPTTKPAPKDAETIQVGDDFATILEEVQLPKRAPKAVLPNEGQSPKPEPEIATPPPERTPAPPDTQNAEPQKNGTLPTMRTLGRDLKRMVKVDNLSMVKAAALESDKRSAMLAQETSDDETTLPKRAPRKRKRFVLVILAVFLVGISALAIFSYLTKPITQKGTSAIITPSDILFAESTVSLQTSHTSAATLKHWITQARTTTTLTLGAITRVVPITTDTDPNTFVETERVATAAEFLASIEAAAPNELTRALGPDFFFGLHSIGENVPVLVLTVTSYERAFSGMLAWEETINRNLAPIYTQLPDTIEKAGVQEKRPFEDLVIRNYDTRVLRDGNGDIRMIYAFPNRSLLIIAESPYSFTEALSRLRAARQL